MLLRFIATKILVGTELEMVCAYRLPEPSPFCWPAVSLCCWWLFSGH